MSRFSIDPDIRRAATLPSDFYTDEEVFQLSKEKIFCRTWQFVGRPKGTQACPFTLLPELLSEPLLIIHSENNSSCLSNVCTHRGKILVEEECDLSLIKCGYHGRRFDLGGKFLSMPEFEDAVDFPTEADDLVKVPMGTALGFDFVSLEPAVPLGEFVEGINVADLVGANFDRLKFVSRREYPVNAHWALYCENYLEGFHIPYVHKGLNQVVDYGTYETRTMRYASVQIAMDKDGAAAASYLFLFPNTMLNFYPWGVSVNVVRPVTPSSSIIDYHTYVSDETQVGEGAGADLDTVELEDDAVVESVQKGIRSRYYSRGRYSPTREQGTHHFHRLIAEFIQ